MTEHPNHDQLIGYVLQTINDELREEIDHHLRQCTQCRTLLDEHEATVKRIRYGLAGELGRLPPAKQLTFASIAPQVVRARRWTTWRFTISRGLSLGGEIALWSLLIIGFLYLLGGPLRLKPAIVPTTQPSSPPSTTLPTGEASFTGPDLKLYTDEPVLHTGSKDAWDSGWVEPGAVIFYDGKFYMFYNGGPEDGNTVSIGYATSSDGITWTRATSEPVFTSHDILWQSTPRFVMATSVLVEENTWVLYFTAANTDKPAYGKVGRATASSPLGPWKVNPEPVLLPGEHGRWDAGGVGDADVIRTSDGYAMYYNSGTPFNKIGLATSPDGITWTKYNDPSTLATPFADSDPVLKADQKWETNSLSSPSVQRVGERWIMTYMAGPYTGAGYAISEDGIHWIKFPNNPLVSPVTEKGIKNVSATRLIVRNQKVFLYYGAKLEGVASSVIFVATWQEP
jgi:predicted GH43/DUF377 family glycosyl hydrolase